MLIQGFECFFRSKLTLQWIEYVDGDLSGNYSLQLFRTKKLDELCMRIDEATLDLARIKVYGNVFGPKNISSY